MNEYPNACCISSLNIHSFLKSELLIYPIGSSQICHFPSMVEKLPRFSGCKRGSRRLRDNTCDLKLHPSPSPACQI